MREVKSTVVILSAERRECTPVQNARRSRNLGSILAGYLAEGRVQGVSRGYGVYKGAHERCYVVELDTRCRANSVKVHDLLSDAELFNQECILVRGVHVSGRPEVHLLYCESGELVRIGSNLRLRHPHENPDEYTVLHGRTWVIE